MKITEPGWKSAAWLEALPGEPIDLAHCFQCGQIFRWRRTGDTWLGSLRGTALALREGAGGVAVASAGDPIAPAEVAHFLGLEDRLAQIGRRIDTDPAVHACLEALPGLRILRQDPWECLISYICSAWNNIPKINRSMERIAQVWGERHALSVAGARVEIHTFPTPAALAAATEEALRGCGLGYRAPYVLQTARRIAAGELDLETLKGLDYAQALAAVTRLPGIGRKVADCILLFSLDKTEAFPVDVWVRRLVHEYYGFAVTPARGRDGGTGGRGDGETRRRGDAETRRRGEEGVKEPGLNTQHSTLNTQHPTPTAPTLGNREYDAIQRFAWERWGEWAGYAQQYLFYGKRLGII